MNIIEKRVKDLKPYEKNPRKNDDAVQYVANSIKEFGFRVPIVIDSDNNIVCGHTRWKACKKLKIDTVPCVVADDLTEEQIRAYRLADNKVGEKAEWDLALLDTELAEIETIDMTLLGFDDKEEETPQEVVEDDFDEEPPAEPKAKYGDIYQLGRHKLLCGDSTKIEDVEKLMDGCKADMVFTDSPYGINAVGDNGEVGADDFGIAKKGKYKKIIADDTTETAQQAYDIYSQLCDKMILWGGNYFLDFLPASDGWLIWDKRGESGIRNTFADGEMAWCSFHTPVRIYHQLWNGMIREGEHEKRVHPTQKPIRMLSEILRDFTNEGDIILDVFGGSGSTLIACEQTGRTCYMAELSPEYVDVIINRWETFTGQKAVKLNAD